MRSAIINIAASLYRWVISPFLHALFGPTYGCRFQPTCGEYGRQAVETHGFIRGGALAVRRVCRCHPWGGCGHDPVPPARVYGTRAHRNCRA